MKNNFEIAAEHLDKNDPKYKEKLMTLKFKSMIYTIKHDGLSYDYSRGYRSTISIYDDLSKYRQYGLQDLNPNAVVKIG